MREGIQGLRQAGVVEGLACADQLFIDLEELAIKHHGERTRCLEGWLRRQDSSSTWPNPGVTWQSESWNPMPPNMLVSVVGEQETCGQFQRQITPESGPPQPLPPPANQLRSRAQHTLCFTNAELCRMENDKKSKSDKPPILARHKDELETPEDRVDRLKKASLINSGEPDLKKKKKKKVAFTISSKRLDSAQKSWLQRTTSSRAYEIGSGLLIAFNAAALGWEVQWASEHARDEALKNSTETSSSPFFDVLSALFTFAFTIELGLRWVAEGFFDFFRTDELGWCVLDIVVVGVGLLELVSSVVFQGNMPLAHEITLLRILRIMRVVKVLRIIRVVRFFRELRMMIFSIMSSLKSVMWVVLVLSMLFFCFGIALTSGTMDFLLEHTTQGHNAWQDPVHADLVNSFGTLDQSFLSLLMAMSGGNDWSLYYQALKPLQFSYRVLFLLFITFSIFAVVNIVTGVFVQSALENDKHDREIVVHEELESKKEYCEAMRQFFEEIDEDGTGTIGFEEFLGKLDDERVVAYFNALKLDVSDASMLFNLLDFDQSGEIHIDEFLLGCYKLQGESRNLDMKVMQLEVRYLREAFHHFEAHTMARLNASPTEKASDGDPANEVASNRQFLAEST